MKKLVVTPISNTIWWATVNEEKGLITGNKEDVTDNALSAVFEHFRNLDGWSGNGFAGYEYPKSDGTGTATLCAFNNNTHVCLSKKLYEELLETKHMYDELCK